MAEILVAMDALPAPRPATDWAAFTAAPSATFQSAAIAPAGPPAVDPLIVVAHDRAAPFAGTIAQLHRAVEQARWRAGRTAMRIGVIGVGADGPAALVAGNLAAEAALAGTRTLLVDGNLATPVQDGLFGVRRQPGLAEVLQGRHTAASAVFPSPLANLSLLPAGSATGGAPMLATGRLAGALAALPAAFDLIVVDLGSGDQDAVAACDGLDMAVPVVARGDGAEARAAELGRWLQSRNILLAGSVTID